VHDYAARAATTWVDAYLLSGSTTRGDLLSSDQRAQIIDLWLQHLPAERLIACCWNPADVGNAETRQVAPMVVLQGLPDQTAALKFVKALPTSVHIYSHPMYTPTTFGTSVAAAAANASSLPAGGKIAKITPQRITELRAAVGSEFRLWDGSSRHIARSVQAGATGVIATPLSHVPESFSTAEVGELQRTIDGVQASLDSRPDRQSRRAFLAHLAFSTKD
jgi:hypothetical protein